MKSCSLCKTVVRDDANFCTFCGTKIQTLNEMIDEKHNEFIKNNIDFANNNKTNVINEDLDFEDTKPQKTRTIFILILCILFLSLILNLLVSDSRNDISLGTVKVEASDSKYIEKFLGEIEVNYEFSLKKDSKMPLINSFMFSQLEDAFEHLEIDSKKVSSLNFNKTNDGNYSVRFNYDNQKFEAFYNESGELMSINNAFNDKIFERENMEEISGISNVPYEDMLLLSEISKKIINLIHNYPTISKFPSITNEQQYWKMLSEEDIITVSSHVNSKNENGIILRDKFKIKFVKDGEGYKIVDLIFNGDKSNKLVY